MVTPSGYKPLSSKNFPDATSADGAYAKAKNDAQFLGQADALAAAERKLQGTRDDAVLTQERLGEIHTGRIGEISQLLQAQLGQNTQRTRDVYEGAQGHIGSAWDRAQQASQGASERVQSDLQQAMERLGLQAAAKDPMQKLSQQLIDNRARLTQEGAGAVGQAGNLGADLTALMVKGESDSAQEWAGRQDEFGRQVQRAVLQIDTEFMQRRNEILQQVSTLEGQRGSQFVVDLMDTIDRRLARERQDRMDALTAEIQRGQLAVSRGNLALQQRKHADSMRLAQQQAEKGSTPLERLRGRVEVARLQREYSDLTNPQAADSARQYRGQEGVANWAQDFLGDRAPGAVNHYWNARTQSDAAASGRGISGDEIFRQYVASLPHEDRYTYMTMDNIFNNQYSSFKD